MTTLNPEQEQACTTFLNFLTDPNKKTLILNGDAGSGKTFLTTQFLQLAKQQSNILSVLCNEKHELNYMLGATTNKAAAVLEKLSNMSADTIHSHLRLFVRDDYTNGKQVLTKTKNYQVVENTLVIIDEASMIDRYLQKYINESTLRCKTLFVGDALQLPPVFENCSPIFSQGYEQITLTNQCRHQGIPELGRIVQQFKDSVVTGEFKPLVLNSPNIQLLDGKAFQTKLLDTYTKDPINTRTLAYTNKKTQQYNSFIKANLCQSEGYNPGEWFIHNGVYFNTHEDKPVLNNEETCQIQSVAPSNRTLTVANKVIDLPVFELMVWAPAYNQGTGAHKVVVVPQDWELAAELSKAATANKDWKAYFYIKKHLADLRMPYASTVHKAQGDTFKNVFINLNDISKCNDPNLVARMLYVAFSRATENIYLYGNLAEKYGVISNG